MNQVIIVGKVLAVEPIRRCVLIETERNFRNENGEYDIDLIGVEISKGIDFDRIDLYDLIGIKGRIQSGFGTQTIIAEKVSFLISGK